MGERGPKYSLLTKAGIFFSTVILAGQLGCNSSTTAPEATPTNAIPALALRSPTPSETSTPTSTAPATETNTPTIESLKPLTIEQRQYLLANPDFFTKPLDTSGRLILTSQFDDSQYNGIIGPENRNLRCGEAVVATILKTYVYFATGVVPDITIASVSNQFHLNGSMNENQLWNAITKLGENYGLSISILPLMPSCNNDCDSAATQPQWHNYFIAAQKNIFSLGNVSFMRFWKHGEEHYAVIASGNEKNALFVDSIGSGDQGFVGVHDLGSYLEKVPDDKVPNSDKPMKMEPYKLANQVVFFELTGANEDTK